MRNLKKFLALVLAMMMVFSLMVTANAADFADEDKITPAYDEAVQVLKGLGIIEGDGTGDLDPQGTFNRAYLATIAYRIGSGSTASSSAELYRGTGKFDDVPETHWANPYVNYAEISQWVHGESDTKFNPDGEVTGYHVLALLLQMMGYGQKGEFMGNLWYLRTATLARELGITAGLTDAQLAKTATREQVFELMFEAIQRPKVEYYIITDSYRQLYVDQSKSSSTNIVTIYAPDTVQDVPYSLGYQWFRLLQSGTLTVDDWGRPGYYWYKDANVSATYAYPEKIYAATKYVPMVPAYTTPVTECDIAEDTYGGRDITGVTIYTNGDTGTANGTHGNVRTGQTITAKETKSVIGGQGRVTEVYDITGNGKPDRIVRIDTLLAKVTGVTKATFDKAGHISKYATITLDVYDQDNHTSEVVVSKEDDYDETNWEYSKGDYVLINAWGSDRTATKNTTTDFKSSAHNDKGLVYSDEENFPAGRTSYQYVEILHEAYSEVATQNVIYRNRDQHDVGGTVYDDNNRLHLDVAGINKGSYLWLFDDYDNVIGIAPATVASKYGVVTYLYMDRPTRGDDVAYADITYTDGTTDENVVVASIDMYEEGAYYTCTPIYGDTSDNVYDVDTTKKTVVIARSARTNGVDEDSIVYTELFAVTTNSDGSVNLGAVNEMTNVTIKKGQSTMSGTPGKGSSATDIYVNDYTEFLLLTGSAYSNYKLENIVGFKFSAYSGADCVDYYDVDGDNVVDYALIVGESNASTGKGLAYIESSRISYNTRTGVYTIYTTNLNGEESEIQTRSGAIASALEQNTDTLFYVEYTGDYVTAIEQIVDTGKSNYITNYNVIYLEGATANGRILYQGATASGSPYNISKALVFVYQDGEIVDYTELEDMDLTDCGVYVAYDNRNNEASYVFITDNQLKDDQLDYPVVISYSGGAFVIGDGSKLTIPADQLDSKTEVEDGGELTIEGNVPAGTEISVEGDGKLAIEGDVKKGAKITVDNPESITIEGEQEEPIIINTDGYESSSDNSLELGDLNPNILYTVDDDKSSESNTNGMKKIPKGSVIVRVVGPGTYFLHIIDADGCEEMHSGGETVGDGSDTGWKIALNDPASEVTKGNTDHTMATYDAAHGPYTIVLFKADSDKPAADVTEDELIFSITVDLGAEEE